MSGNVNDSLQEAVAQSFASIVEKDMVERVAEELDRLKQDPALKGKIRYKTKLEKNGDVVFKVRLGFRRLGEIDVHADERIACWTRGGLTFSFAAKDPAAESVKDLAEDAYEMKGLKKYKPGQKKGVLVNAFNGLEARRAHDPVLDAIVRGLTTIEEHYADADGFKWTADCSVNDHTYLNTSVGRISVVDNGDVSFILPNGVPGARILQPTQAETLKFIKVVAAYADDLGQLKQSNQAAVPQTPSRPKPKRLTLN